MACQFLVAAKRYDQNRKDFLSDRLYGLDASGTVISRPDPLTHDRFNGKLVRDHTGTLYQLNLEHGLIRIADNQPIVPVGRVTVDSESRCGLAADVYVGLQQTVDGSWSHPMLDAAFDAQGYVYVVPVTIVPELDTPYMAAAKLKLGDPGQNPGYSIEWIFDDPPAANDNLDPNQLREVEVDGAGNVYVLNCQHLNSSDLLWVYRPDGRLARRVETQDLASPQEIGISAPVGLCVSSYDASRLYVASSENPPDANTVKLYVLSTNDLSLSQTMEVRDMGHITDIAEDPTDGTICLVGFIMSKIPPASQLQDISILGEQPFYQPRLATIRPSDAGPIEAICPTDAAPTVDMTLPVSMIYAGQATASRNAAH